MAHEYIIYTAFRSQWHQGQAASGKLLHNSRDSAGRSYLPVHGDPVLSQLDDRDLVCYFVYTLSSWWEIPLIDRINGNREDNKFAILMDINPAPETYFRLMHVDTRTPESRYKTGLREMFPSIETPAVDAMYNLVRNGFGHNLFGREPNKIRFNNSFQCPPNLDDDNVLLVPPIQLALSMVTAFLARIAMLLQYPDEERMQVFKAYMTGQALAQT